MEEQRILAELHDLRNMVTDLFSLLAIYTPQTLTVSQIAKSLGKSNGTIRVHLEGNFLKGVDYSQEVEGGKMEIPRATALKVSKYYLAKKGAKNV
ncbi:hypothetical protein MNB_SV-13-1038 [hydrothermal vent metagenome]|uniref:Uncharacterized protein n=1 Tax=hydrothermal vent metagenome TaxID=652676 RepID=A0A1W1CZZ6_9ZZZZ